MADKKAFWQRAGLILVFYIIVPFMLFELGSTLYLRFAAGFESTREAVLAAYPKGGFFAEKKEDECTWMDAMYPHPYLSYVFNDIEPCGGKLAWKPVPINNARLPSAHDLYFEEKPGYFTVLLSGGSVASNLGVYGVYGTDETISWFEKELNRRFTSPTGEPFRVINGAIGGWKYPNQFILFGLYAGAIDAIVTLDGFNEYMVIRETGRPDWVLPLEEPYLETPTTAYAWIHPAASLGYAEIARDALALSLQKSFLRTPVLSQSYGAALIVRSILLPMSRSTLEGMHGSTLMQQTEPAFEMPGEVSEQERYRTGLQAYQRYLQMMDAVSERLEVRNIHFLQPAPALYKKLTLKERMRAGDLSYAEGYRKLTDDMLSLTKEGLPVYDLRRVFEGHDEWIYGDEIHPRFDGIGYRLMIEAMMQAMAREWGLKPRLN